MERPARHGLNSIVANNRLFTRCEIISLFDIDFLLLVYLSIDYGLYRGGAKMKPKALNVLTSLRFFAAAAVVYFHMQGKIIAMPAQPQFALGVSFFFVLSGFILTYVYGDMRNHNIFGFYKARLARVWPIHIVTLCVTLYFIVPHLLFRPGWGTPLLSNILLVQAWIPITGYVFSFNGVSWSISTELAFYLIFPFLASSNRFWVFYAAIAALCFCILTIVNLSGASLSSTKLFEFSASHLILQHPAVRLLEFATGVAAGKIFLNRKVEIGTLGEVAAIVAVLAYALTSNLLRPWLGGALGLWYTQSGGFLLFAVAIYVFACSTGRISQVLSHRIFVRLGEISFATYMIHQIVIRIAVANGWVESYGAPISTIGVIAFTYLASYILWTGVENPARRVILHGLPHLFDNRELTKRPRSGI